MKALIGFRNLGEYISVPLFAYTSLLKLTHYRALTPLASGIHLASLRAHSCGQTAWRASLVRA